MSIARDTVRVERRGRVGWLVLNRPERLNAFDEALRREMLAALRELLSDREARVVVITGAGRAFCAGADIAYLKELFGRADRRTFSQLLETGGEIAVLVRGSDKPVIAAVNGAAAGGGANLALACDLRIASDQASIGQTFVRIGLHPDWGGTFFLPRLVGTSRALELMWTGRMVAAAEALSLGLFDKVVAPERLEGEVTELGDALAEISPDVAGLIKASVYQAAERSLQEALVIEHRHQLSLFGGTNAVEGLTAFLDKRRPAFRGTPT